MPSVRVRALSVCLSVTALVALTGCAKAATVSGPAWGTPAEAIEAALGKLSEGFDFTGQSDTSTGRDLMHGTEIQAEDKLSLVRTDAAATTGTRSIQIGDELWMRYEGIAGFPEEWGHLATGGGVFASGAGFIGPATWLPALLDEIVAVERTSGRRYAGTLDLGAVPFQETGLSSYQQNLLTDTDEVAFTIQLAPDGHIEHFAFTVEIGDDANEIAYNFSEYGKARDVTPPTGEEVTELTTATIVEWLLGGYGE